MNKTARAWTFQLMKKGIILLDINDCVKKKKGKRGLTVCSVFLCYKGFYRKKMFTVR